MSVICEVQDGGKLLPAVTPETPVYYVAVSGSPHSSGVRKRSKDLTPADLDDVVKNSLAARGYKPADDTNPPTLVLNYQWGEWRADGLPEQDLAASNRRLAIQKIHTRAVIAGGELFAKQFRDALTESATQGELNRQSFSGRGNPAANAMAQMSVANDPVMQFQRNSAKRMFLVDQATSDCYFIVVSAYSYDQATASKGYLVWRCSLTTGTRRASIQEAIPRLIEAATPWFGRPMAEAEVLPQKAKAK